MIIKKSGNNYIKCFSTLSIFLLMALAPISNRIFENIIELKDLKMSDLDDMIKENQIKLQNLRFAMLTWPKK